jgi:hypothetical protein
MSSTNKHYASSYPYGILNTIYIDFAYHKITKHYNIICLMFHVFILLLQICFIIENFTFDLIARYGCFILLTVTVSMLLS